MRLKKTVSKEVPASLWIRIFAYLIDSILVTLIIVLPLTSNLEDSSFTSYESFSSNFALTKTVFIIGFFVALLSILYWAILEYKERQSVGKWLLRIHVKSTTGTLTFSQCVIRNVTKLGSLFLFLDCLYMIFKKTHQRYFETLSKTEVVRGETKA